MSLLKLFYFTSLLFLVVIVGKAQSFDDHIRSADSLANLKEYEAATLEYQSALESLNNLDISLGNWRNAMVRAGDAAFAAGKQSSARRFYNAAYGHLGEKISDKIEYLAAMPAVNFFTFWSEADFMMENVNKRLCTSQQTKYLIWFQNNSTYVQGFSECETFRPIDMKDSALKDFFEKNRTKLLAESIETVGYKPNDVVTLHFEFKEGDRSFSKSFNEKFDLVEPNFTAQQLKDPILKKGVEIYHNNVKTSLYSFYLLVKKLVASYDRAIFSVDQLKRIGKI